MGWSSSSFRRLLLLLSADVDMNDEEGVVALDEWAAFAFLPGLGPGFSLLVEEEDEGGGEDPFLCFAVDDLVDAVVVVDGSWLASVLSFCFLAFFGVDDEAVVEGSLLLLRASGLEEDVCAECVDAAWPGAFATGEVGAVASSIHAYFFCDKFFKKLLLCWWSDMLADV